MGFDAGSIADVGWGSWNALQMGQEGTGSALEEAGEHRVASTRIPSDSMSASRRRARVPDSQSLSVQVSSSNP